MNGKTKRGGGACVDFRSGVACVPGVGILDSQLSRRPALATPQTSSPARRPAPPSAPMPLNRRFRTSSVIRSAGSSILLLPVRDRPNPLAPFPGISRIERIPSAHAARLDAQEASPGVFRPQIRHALRLGLPRVPHHGVRQHVSLEPEPGLAALGQDGDGLLRSDGVDPVGFGGDGERFVRRGGRGGGGFGFVQEGGGLEPSDGRLGYVLQGGHA